MCASKTMKRSGFLSACVVSWCAAANRASAALEGLSGTRMMSLYALRALRSLTVFHYENDA